MNANPNGATPPLHAAVRALLETAPTPALAFDAQGRRAFGNAALAAWSARRGGALDADALAADLARQLRDGGARHGVDATRGLAWRAVPADGDGGWVCWLTPDEAAAPGLLDFDVREVGMTPWRLDLGTGRVHVGATGAAVLGWPSADDGVDAASLVDCTHPEDRSALQQAFVATRRAAVQTDLVARMRRVDGRWAHILLRCGSVRDAEGRACALIGVALDITRYVGERDRARALGQSLDLITDALGVGVWSTDSDGTLTWNTQMRRIYGVPDELSLADAAAVAASTTHPDDAPAMGRAMQALAEGHDAPPSLAFRIRRPDGQVRHLVGRARRGEADSGLAMFGVAMDVTEQREAALRLRDAEVARAAAEQASIAKSQFLSRVSHELRTPLNAILGFAGVMAQETEAAERLGPNQRQRLDSVVAAGQHLAALLQDLLDLGALETRELPLQCAPVDLDAVADDTLRWMAGQARQAGLAWPDGSGAPRIGRATVLADTRRLRQVLINLLSNAIKYTGPGGHVRLRALADEARCGIAIANSGPPLDDEQRAQLFHPFHRLGAERSAVPGTGIGLSVALALARAMGGELHAQAADGMSVEMCLWLPRPPRLGDVDARAAVPTAAAPAIAPAEARTALYIEDNEVNALLMEHLFSLRPAWTLHIARSGAQGLAMARALRPALLLVDMQLPDTDGVQLLRALRAAPEVGTAARCIVVSANALPRDIAAARAAGFDDYWTKPLDVPQVLAMLDASPPSA